MISRLVKILVSLFVLVYDESVRIVNLLISRSHDDHLVILYYHSIPDHETGRFSAQMRMARRVGFPASLDHFDLGRSGKRIFSITFDDGFESVVRNALPVLRALGIPSTIFIPSDFPGLLPPWLTGTRHPDRDDRIVSPEKIKALDADPLVSIGSHCMTHRDLTRLSDQESMREITCSKKQLEEITSNCISAISYPHGAFNGLHVRYAADAGYVRQYSIWPERVSKSHGAVIGRVKVDPSDWAIEFFLKITGSYRWMAAVSRWKKQILGNHQKNH